MKTVILLMSLALLTAATAAPAGDEAQPAAFNYVPMAPDELPEESFERPPEAPFDKSGYVFGMENLASFYDHPGEYGHFMPGAEYGFESLSFIVTETRPGGGPPLHVHDEEEAHVLLAGKMDYIIGDQRLSAEAPYIAKVPAGVPHTFVNIGDQPLNLIGILASSTPTYEPLGENPLTEKSEAEMSEAEAPEE